MSKFCKFTMLALVGLALTCFSTRAGAPDMASEAKQDGVIIRIVEAGPSVDPNSPRTPAVIPVSCYFDNVSGNLNFTFLFPMGDVTITLTEASAGVVSSDEYSTASCLVAVPVPGTGTYEITLTLESGVEFIGQFMYN